MPRRQPSLPSLAVVPAQAIVAEGVYRSKHRAYGVAQVAQRHRLGPPSEDRWGGSKRTRRRPVAVATADPPVPHHLLLLLFLLLLLLLLFLFFFFFLFRPSLLSSRAMPAAVPSAEEPGKAALRRPLRFHPAQLDHLVLVQVVLLVAQCQDVLPSLRASSRVLCQRGARRGEGRDLVRPPRGMVTRAGPQWQRSRETVGTPPRLEKRGKKGDFERRDWFSELGFPRV